MKLSSTQEDRFKIAAGILEESRKATEKFKSRTDGITNGDSDRKKEAIARLLSKAK